MCLVYVVLGIEPMVFMHARQALYQPVPHFIEVMKCCIIDLADPCCCKIHLTWEWETKNMLKLLTCKQEDLSVGLQHPCKSLDCSHICISSEGSGTGRSLELTGQKSFLLMSSGFSRNPVLNDKWSAMYSGSHLSSQDSGGGRQDSVRLRLPWTTYPRVARTVLEDLSGVIEISDLHTFLLDAAGENHIK